MEAEESRQKESKKAETDGWYLEKRRRLSSCLDTSGIYSVERGTPGVEIPPTSLFNATSVPPSPACQQRHTKGAMSA